LSGSPDLRAALARSPPRT
jgi:virginiamycin B lyase